MAVLRVAPGEPVPIAGTYALVGHYGEPMGFSKWFAAGEQFPVVYATGPLWFVLEERSEPAALAA